MLEVVTYIEIQQNATKAFPGRKKKILFDFVNEFEVSDSWEDFTNQAKITQAKSLSYRDDNNKLQPINNIGSGTDPLLLKGDSVSISTGYRYFDEQGNRQTRVAEIFRGYVTKVSPKKPFEIECEDNMWILKQTPAIKGEYKDSMEKMLQSFMPSGLTVNQKSQTKVGTFTVQDGETVAQVLMRLRKECHLEAFFDGNELTIGFLVYDEQKAQERESKLKRVFQFQYNIIEDQLEYSRKDDIRLSAVAKSFKISETGGTCKDGSKKTKQESVEVLVYTDKNGNFQTLVKQDGKDFPPNDEGERRTFFYLNVTDTKELARRATATLQQYYYTGFRGSFTTFGMPQVNSGDRIYLIDKVLPERSGYYWVRKVNTKGGVNGIRQEITLDYKVMELTEEEINKYVR